MLDCQGQTHFMKVLDFADDLVDDDDTDDEFFDALEDRWLSKVKADASVHIM
jgi:hypothetical protein